MENSLKNQNSQVDFTFSTGKGELIPHSKGHLDLAKPAPPDSVAAATATVL